MPSFLNDNFHLKLKWSALSIRVY
uniref:Uncharacterized protein n=1 Tax=Anguilla anguilla TaxID=7936 RepID=A0A0E9TMT2_ANGAN